MNGTCTELHLELLRRSTTKRFDPPHPREQFLVGGHISMNTLSIALIASMIMRGISVRGNLCAYTRTNIVMLSYIN